MNGSESSVDKKEPKISEKTSDAIENVKSICSVEMEVGVTLQAEGNSSQAGSSTEENLSMDGEANIKTLPNRESEEKQGAPSRKTEEENQLRNIHGSEEHKANKPFNSVSEDHPEGINQDVSDVPSNSVNLNEQGNEVSTSKLSFEEKVKHLHEMFKSFPPVMIKRVLQREDVKEDISMAISCLKAMSSTEKNSRMQTKIRNINDDDDEEYPKASGTEESATNTEDSNDPHCKNLFDDPNKQSDVSLEAKVKQLKACFKPSLPTVLIKKVLQRDDVKGDFLAAKRCLKDMVPIEEGPKQPLSEKKQKSLLGRSKSFPILDKDSIGSLDTTCSSTSEEDEGATAQIHPTASISAGSMSMTCRNVNISWKPEKFVKENTLLRPLEKNAEHQDPTEHTPQRNDMQNGRLLVKAQDSKLEPENSKAKLHEIAVIVDKNIMEFISSTNRLSELKDSLRSLGLNLEYTAGDSSVYIARKVSGETFAEERGIEAVANFTKRFKTIELDVDTNHWDAVISEISKLRSEIGESKLLIKKSFSKDNVTIVCRDSDFTNFKKRFSDKIAETHSLERKAAYVRKTFDIEVCTLDLFLTTGFIEKLRAQCDDLQIVTNKRNGRVTIVGPEQQCSMAKLKVDRELLNVCKVKISLSPSAYEMLGNEEGQLERVYAELERKDIHALYYYCEDEEEANTTITVVGINKKHAEDAAELIKSIITEIKVKVDRDMMEVLRRQNICWSGLCDEVERVFKVYFRGNEFDTWTIAGFKEDVSSAHERIQKFLESFESITFTCPDIGVRRYILEHRKEELLRMESYYSVKIEAGKRADAFLISGTKKGVADVRRDLHTLTVSVVMNKMKVQQPGLHKFFTSGRGDMLVKSVKHEHHCEIQTTEEISSMTCRNVRISWKAGSVVKENADILVGLMTGQVFEAFQNAGGPGFRILHMSDENPSSKILIVRSGGNLPCEKVILTTCCHWDGEKGKAEKELRSTVQQCLLKAEQLDATSIAFPIIGIGGLGFPKNTACHIMISEVIRVTSGWGTSSLNEICFVVFDEDEQLINLFQQEFIFAIKCLNVFKNVSVCVLQGDLVQEQSDAIVNMNSIGMDMQKAGALSKAVSAAAGPSVQVECSSLGKQSPGSVVVTGAGNLEANHIIHVIPGKADVGHIQNCIEECLRVADRKGFKSISMSGFGTAGLNMSYDDSAHAIFQALKTVCPNFQNLKHIRIVIFQGVGFESMVSIFEQVRQQYLTESRAPDPELDTYVSGHDFWGIILRLYGRKQDINKAQAALNKGFTDACKTQAVENNYASKLSERQRQKLKTKARQIDVTIQFEDRSQRIVVRGDQDDVSVIINDIWEEIQKRHKKEKENEQAKVLYKTIKWQYEIHGKRKYFNKSLNAVIEKAHANNDSRVTVEVQEEKYVIMFAQSTGTGLSTGQTMTVTRTTVGSAAGHGEGIALPKQWSPMPKDSSGKEATAHLVALAAGSAEYQKVLNLFQSTGGTGRVISIERIQNPHLYQQYMVRKQKMDKDNPGMNNERQIFHGTADKNVNDIITTGFNRSYCGAHGVAYGKGVYFARDASYSMGYSQSTGNQGYLHQMMGLQGMTQLGSRPMFLARVLVGKYTNGNPAMIVPPRGFDSVANSTGSGASIFVVFYDSQCYPEYLITFQ